MTRSHNLGMRILSLALCLVCLLPLVQPVAASAETAEQTAQTLTTVVRRRGSSRAEVIGQMENGTELTVLKTGKTYYKVDCYDMKGYIAKSQILHTEDGKYYVNCQKGSSETRVLTYTDYSEALALRQTILERAKKYLGVRYVYGGRSPRGFDCSGFTSYVYEKVGIDLHRTASTQLQDGIVVTKEGMQIGDLVFFRQGTSKPASHVGIYVGNNQMIHAGSKGICIADLDNDYCSKYFVCARRIINTGAAQVETVSVVETTPSALSVNSASGRTAN